MFWDDEGEPVALLESKWPVSGLLMIGWLHLRVSKALQL